MKIQHVLSAKAIGAHRGGHASEAEGKSVLDHLLASDLLRVDEIKLARSGGRSDLRKGVVLTPAGKAALRRLNVVPQSPQSPADVLQDNAGGDPLGPPQPQGGCGGSAGHYTNEVDDTLQR